MEFAAEKEIPQFVADRSGLFKRKLVLGIHHRFEHGDLHEVKKTDPLFTHVIYICLPILFGELVPEVQRVFYNIGVITSAEAAISCYLKYQYPGRIDPLP